MNEKFKQERKDQLKEDMKVMADMMTKSVAESDAKETAAIGEMKREISAKKIQQAQDGIKAVEKKIIATKDEVTA